MLYDLTLFCLNFSSSKSIYFDCFTSPDVGWALPTEAQYIVVGTAHPMENQAAELLTRSFSRQTKSTPLIFAVAALEVDRFAEAFAALHDPVGDPLDDVRFADNRSAEQIVPLAAVAQQGVGRLFADKLHLLVHELAELPLTND